MKLWSRRPLTNAKAAPSGDQRRPLADPFKFMALFTSSPEDFIVKIWPPRKNATVSPFGEIAGPCPSVNFLAGEPSRVTIQIACSDFSGLDAGLGLSRPISKSPPRANSRYLPSDAHTRSSI